jgi:hypothetical protein
MRPVIAFTLSVLLWAVIFLALAWAVAHAGEASLAWGPINGGGDRGPALVAVLQQDWYGIHGGGFERRGEQVVFAGADAILRLTRGRWFSQHGIGLTLFDRKPDWLGSQAMFRLHARVGMMLGAWTVALGWSHWSNAYPLNRFVEQNGGGDFGVVALGWRW